MQAFEFARAGSAADAVAKASGDAAYLAGGHTLLPAMKARLRAPERLVDLSRAGLSGIEADRERLWIGATTTHAEVAASDTVRNAIPGLATLASLIGDPAVRNRGTIGGSVANNDPSADYPAALLALDAVVETDRGRHAADDFFQGMFTTALADGELITRVGFRIPTKSAYAKFRHPASRYALAGVYVATLGGAVRVAVTGACYAVTRWAAAEAALAADFSPAAVAGLTLESDDLNSDMHASAEYRAHLCGVMLRQAMAELTA
ncbi:FAD binding domain-containing protein [Sandaracinobacteroides saxicola]|uniref:FAD binding domain-containing protein n=1 Tax=Sandaracinobacteroides saxicola TaxID=2759707 RepID=A0A7G5IFS3_9SPHN|nr:FAD binding domain-containing protein [Sandaracinobacteroides saxicola]QMW22215.1 FAD binding domain-containing protein [Sandaracinobacteroides saxicola]